MAVNAPQDAVIFDYPGGRFVALASDIECFEMDLSVKGAGKPINLDQYVDIQAAPDIPVRRLLTARSNKVLTTTASIHFATVDADRFFLLPWLLRQASCDKWVRGVVELDNPDHDAILAVWIDLSQLAASSHK